MLNILKIPFKPKDGTRTFSDRQKQKGFITSGPTLQGMLKKVPSGRRKMMSGRNFNLQKRNEALEV